MVPPTRNKGTSDPTSAVMRNFSSGAIRALRAFSVATMLAMEKALKARIAPEEKLRITAEVGSDVPLFLVGGTILGLGRGEQVYPLADLPAIPCVIATPALGVSTARAFADWDKLMAEADTAPSGRHKSSSNIATSYTTHTPKLTENSSFDRINGFSLGVFSWLCSSATAVSAKGGGRAEAPLLDLVRAGIENDFERVDFLQHPTLRDVNRPLEIAAPL